MRPTRVQACDTQALVGWVDAIRVLHLRSCTVERTVDPQIPYLSHTRHAYSRGLNCPNPGMVARSPRKQRRYLGRSRT